MIYQRNRDRRIAVLDANAGEFAPFYSLLSSTRKVTIHTSPSEIPAADLDASYPLLCDVQTVRDSFGGSLAALRSKFGDRPIALLTSLEFEEYLFDLRGLGVFQIGAKSNMARLEELIHFLDCVEDPRNGFGLTGHLHHTSEFHRTSVRGHVDRNAVVEQVINHFATSGFEIHELYNVRLILEEALANALYHAFRDAAGEEKYPRNSDVTLADGEVITIEYGSSSEVAGFAVSDNAGTLGLGTVLAKLERQHSGEGVMDENGRGFYLSQMLSSSLVVNVEEGERSQLIALFDDPRQRRDGAKTFMLNFWGADGTVRSCPDEELD